MSNKDNLTDIVENRPEENPAQIDGASQQVVNEDGEIVTLGQ